MAQNVTIAGASYSAVPSIVVPKTGGGTATFVDTTISSNAAAASDIANGKFAYVNGTLIEGTASGGGTAAITIEDTTDSAGGTIRTITALDISDTTATASDVINNKWFYTSNGTKTQGTGSGGITPTGNINITQSGQTDVTNYATATVSAGTAGTPSATKGTVSNHSISVTPSVTNTTGWITGSTKTGTAVTVSASELVSGNKEITTNGTNIDVANYSTVSVAVPTGTSKNTQVVQSTTRTNSSTMTALSAELTVSKTGTYDIYYSATRTNTSSSYTWATQLYKDGTAQGTENTTWSNNVQNVHLTNQSLTANQKLRVYGRQTRGSSYYVCAPLLAIVES